LLTCLGQQSQKRIKRRSGIGIHRETVMPTSGQRQPKPILIAGKINIGTLRRARRKRGEC
jgi:hypothetical protein